MNVLINILLIAVALVILVFVLGYLLVQLSFVRNHNQDIDHTSPDYVEKRKGYEEYHNKVVEGINYFKTLNYEDVYIDSFDQTTLHGYLQEPDQSPKNRTEQVLVCVHGYRANGLSDFGVKMKYLVSLGWTLLFVEDRAHGQSKGRYIGFGNLDSLDVLEWCKYINNRYGADTKIILHGTSMGGATVLAAAGNPNAPANIKGVIDDCGFSSGYDEVCFQVKKLYHLPVWPFVPVANMFLRKAAHYSLKDRAAKDLIGNFKGELLVIHGTSDTVVPPSMAKEIYDAANCSKDILFVDGASHMLSYMLNREAYEEKFGQLISRVLQ